MKLRMNRWKRMLKSNDETKIISTIWVYWTLGKICTDICEKEAHVY